MSLIRLGGLTGEIPGNASDLAIIKSGSKEWKEAVNAIILNLEGRQTLGLSAPLMRKGFCKKQSPILN